MTKRTVYGALMVIKKLYLVLVQQLLGSITMFKTNSLRSLPLSRLVRSGSILMRSGHPIGIHKLKHG
jgi:hypothetical protein